jgi:hypothetical protein
MLIAEDLLLLLTRDDSGKLVLSGTESDIGLAGALLVELALHRRVDVAGPEGPAKRGTVVVLDAAPTGDRLLDSALEAISAKPRKPKDVLGKLTRGLRPQLYARLAERGLVREEEGKVLGLFPSNRWPAQDAGHERALRAALDAALVQGLEPEPRTAAVVALLSALRAVPKVVDTAGSGLSKKQLNDRAAQIAEGSWGSAAVRKAIDEMVAAVTVAITTAAVAGSAGSN